MTNTRMSAKNGFQEGLVLDLSPTNSSANSLSSALNATLITYNGNEMSLQNDMGNARVETAFLPEGYVPVGTCEFGDIIYIVSYNPIINKSQIGCFPSPERNISTEEIGDMKQSLSWKDFQGGENEPDGTLKTTSVKKIVYGSKNMNSGDQYIIYSEGLKTDYLSDYGNTDYIHDNFPKLVKIHVVSVEESGKIVYLDSTTKWYDNISYKENGDIEKSGKDYYINVNPIKTNDGKIDIDAYRTLVNSAYSTFSSKVSGKLALLIELEKITGFSCAWEPYINDNKYDIYFHFNWTTNNPNINPCGAVVTKAEWSGVDQNHYGEYLYWKQENNELKLDLVSDTWESMSNPITAFPNTNYKEFNFTRKYCPEDNIPYSDYIDKYEYNKYLPLELANLSIMEEQNRLSVTPYKIVLSKQSDGLPKEGTYYINCDGYHEKGYYYSVEKSNIIKLSEKLINDDLVNNYFHYPVIKKFNSFTMPLEKDGKKPYIDNLIYHYEVTPAMPYGILEEFAQEGYIDFSKIGTKDIKITNWRYHNYENTSTLVWGMDAYTEPEKYIDEVIFEFWDHQGFAAAYHSKGKTSYNGVFTEIIPLNGAGFNYKLNNLDHNGKEHSHIGLEIDSKDIVQGQSYIKEGDKYYIDDSGIIYSNSLYLVKIFVKYGYKNIAGQFHEIETIKDYRWYWTNSLFNEDYYNTIDFKTLQFKLNYDCQAGFKQNDNYKVKVDNYIAKDDYSELVDQNNYYKTLSATVQSVGQTAEEEGNIQMTVLGGLQNNYGTFNLNVGKLNEVDVTIYLAKDELINYPEQPTIKYTGSSDMLGTYEYIQPTMATSDTWDGKADKTTSEQYNKLINSDQQGAGKELWENEAAYKNYVNDFKLTSKEAKGEEKEESLEESNIQYINHKGEADNLSKYEYISKNLSEINYDAQSGNHKYLNLTLSGMHLSKYCYLNKQSENCPLLRPFVLNVDDLSNYNLQCNKTASKSRAIENNPDDMAPDDEAGNIGGGGITTPVYDKDLFFNKALMISNTDSGGHSSYYQMHLLKFSSANNYIGIGDTLVNVKLKDFIGEGDGDISVQVGLSENMDVLKENFNFLFPIGYGYSQYIPELSGEAYDGSEAKVNKTSVISNNRPIPTTSGYYSDGDLGGTLAGISGNNILPGDHHAKHNILVRFVPFVMGYLTQLYYLTDKKDSNVFIPDNYIYLDTNYTTYLRNVVVKLDSDDINELLLIKGFPYQEYLIAIQEKNDESKDEIVINLEDTNVKVKFENCLKSFPVEFRFNYITPTMHSINQITYVDSVFDNVPSSTNQDGLKKDIIYYWTGENFESIRGLQKLRRLKNYGINANNQFEAKYAENLEDFNTESLGTSQLLEVGVDNILSFRNLPTGGKGGEYIVQTHRKQSLTNYQQNLLYYKA